MAKYEHQAKAIAALNFMPPGWPADAPPRSVLYNITPQGVDGKSREELRSYFRRVCVAHHTRPWTIANYLLIPSGRTLGFFKFRQKADQYREVDTAGLGSQAEAWVTTLNALTKREDLGLLTLLNLSRFLPGYKLQSQETRFCPRCFASDEELGRPKYDRLLWTIDAVTACPVHHCELLVEKPPRKGMRAASDIFAPGVSRFTGENLGERESRPAEPLDVACAQRIASLLDDASFFTDATAEKDGVRRFLTYAVEALFNGVAADLAAYLLVGKSQLHGWMHGNFRPSLPRVSQLSLAFDCNIADIVLGNHCELRLMPRGAFTVLKLAGHSRRGASLGRDALVEKLEGMLGERSVTTLRAASEKLDVSDKFLRRIAPDLVAELVERGRALRRLNSEKKIRHQDALYKAEHDGLVREGISPTRRRVLSRVLDKFDASFRWSDWQRAQRRANGGHPPTRRGRNLKISTVNR